MGHQNRTAEAVIGKLARGSHGVVTRTELLAAGLTLKEIRHRLGTGALLRVHPSVYRVGHDAPSIEATYLAAVRACGPGALLSGRAAAHLLGLTKRRRAPRPEVTARTERRVAGVATRRCRKLEPADGMTWRGVPVTTVARTLVDVAASLSLDDLARACHEAEVLHRTTPSEIATVLERRPGSRGAAKLRRIVEGDVRVTLSALERRFLRRLRAVRLPLPVTNRPAGGRYVDCRWPAHRLTVELDSYRFHHSRHSWEQDRRREREARARGDEFRRYTYGDVVDDPRYMLRELHQLLAEHPA